MNIKYALIIAISLTIILFLFSIYKIMYFINKKEPKRYPLRRRNAFTEEEIERILEKMNKKKHLN